MLLILIIIIISVVINYCESLIRKKYESVQSRRFLCIDRWLTVGLLICYLFALFVFKELETMLLLVVIVSFAISSFLLWQTWVNKGRRR